MPRMRSARLIAGLAATLLPESGSLADPLAEEIERGAAGVPMTRDLDLLDAWGVDHEGPLDADARRDAADGDHLVQAAITHPEDRALELLEALAVSFDDAHAHGHRVTRPDLWEIGLLLLGGKRLQDVVHRHGDSAHEEFEG